MITDKMLEILVSVARMPPAYRFVRQRELIDDYEEHLTCHHALEAFNHLIGREQPAMSDKGQACLRVVVRLAGREPSMSP